MRDYVHTIKKKEDELLKKEKQMKDKEVDLEK